ncbi:MAG: hypothetical protein ABI768_10035 [Acidobacteriota bacterium]
MTETRRSALKKALAAAIAAATPASLLLAAGRVGTLKIPLADGSDLEFTERTIFHVKGPGPNEKSRAPMRTAVSNGDFRMRGGGNIVIEQGRIKHSTGGGNSSIFVQEGCCMFAQMPADKGKVSNPAASAKFWVLKNPAGEELEFRFR